MVTQFMSRSCGRQREGKESFEEQGWRSGESTHLPPMWAGFDSWTRRHMWVLVLAPRGFFPDTPVFPSPQKPTLLNSNSIWKVSPITALR